MKKRMLACLSVAFLFLAGYGSDLLAVAPSATALKEATAQGQYLFMVFYDKPDTNYNAMIKQLKRYNDGASKKATIFKIRLPNKAENDMITKYGVMKAKRPLLLVFAPNSVVTGGHEEWISMERLKRSMSFPDLVLKTMKPLQEGKIAMVILQNESTSNNAASLKAVMDFSADERYRSFTEPVKVDPSALGGRDFLRQCGFLKPISRSTVVFLFPPGNIIKVLSGKITKDDVVTAFQSCTNEGARLPSDPRNK